MNEMGLRPDRGHVKCARVVGEVMGKLHPHGDGAIYDALVRMAQPCSMRLPLVDGHGNFGSPARPAGRHALHRVPDGAAAVAMTAAIDEDTVDFQPNYDGREPEPVVLPAAFPNLLVNGATGIAVGMATNMAPHNLVEVVAAPRHLIANPDATPRRPDAVRPRPGPADRRQDRRPRRHPRRLRDRPRHLPDARHRPDRERHPRRRKGIVVTELPYGVGPEKVIEQIKDLVQAKKLQGIADVKDLTDRQHGLRLVIEVKNGFVPEAILEQLYRLTPMEESFGINNVALVDGQPRTLGLQELLEVFLDHRFDVVRRRTTYRRRKGADRLHLVEGLLIAILDIDEVIQLIRSSDDAAAGPGAADGGLRPVRDPGQLHPRHAAAPADQVLPDRAGDGAGRAAARDRGADRDPGRTTSCCETVSDELAEVAKTVRHPAADGAARVGRAGPYRPPCRSRWPTTRAWSCCPAGLLARTATSRDAPAEGTLAAPPQTARGAPAAGPRAAHDVIVAAAAADGPRRGRPGHLPGRLVRLGVLDLPALPPTANAPSLAGGAPLAEFVSLGGGRDRGSPWPRRTGRPAGSRSAPPTAWSSGSPRSTRPAHEWEVIGLKDGDGVVGAVELAGDEATSSSSPPTPSCCASRPRRVRPQGRAAGGMAGIRLAAGATVVFFGAVDPRRGQRRRVVVTVAGSSPALPGTEPGAVKVTPFAEYPAKGRATGGVRCHRFLKGEDTLVLAWAGPAPARAAAASGRAGRPARRRRPPRRLRGRPAGAGRRGRDRRAPLRTSRAEDRQGGRAELAGEAAGSGRRGQEVARSGGGAVRRLAGPDRATGRPAAAASVASRSRGPA